ncbi:hypothetical protein I3843_12G082600 [Carya illinoinensis]|uniref:RING-type E3 ubiquitin transferase n=1 Tax=Carya illinoinensis TaxID=32201 RepID=A0A922DI09_CARIL|nr:hypothetical protein I3842_12G081700 [Carya illinoinensis]KAG7952898.1 hypothetical protein I3843_12G082600 [Carya illinoinensis]
MFRTFHSRVRMAAFQIFFSIFFFFCFFFLPQIASSATICKPSSCDSIQTPPVKFPFRLRGSQEEACGYDPGFDLSCNNQDQTILTLPSSGDFVVADIIYSIQWLYISDPEQCIFRRFLHNFSLSGSPFQLGPYPPYDLHQNATFYNCSSNVTNMHFGYRPIDCLGSDDYKVLIAGTGRVDYSPPPASCRAIGTAMVPFLQMDDSLLIRWDEPSCEICEESGGDCARLNATSPEVGCYNVESNSQTGLPRSAKYGIAVGVGVPGALCVIGLLGYLFGLVRAHTRSRRPSNTESSTSMIPQRIVFATGLDGPTIESYPKTLLGESRRLPKPNDNTCPICLSEYLPKEELRTIPECNHYFHVNCIDAWLKMNATCPICRKSPDGSALTTPWSTSSSSSSLLEV